MLELSAVPPWSTPIRLVVNADGFGAGTARTQGVLAAHANGIVTSTSVLGNCENPQDVRRELASAPNLGVGVQLTLTGGSPVAQPEKISSLLNTEGQLPTQPGDVLLAWAKAALRADDVEREFDAQVARLVDCGLLLDHLCTKDHLGFLPMAAQAMENVARRHAIAGLRMTVERPTLAWTSEFSRALTVATLGGLAWWSRRQLGTRRHGPQTWGYFESGHLDEIRILEILGRLGSGSHELLCHPDVHPAEPSIEMRALTSGRVREALTRRNIALCRWADLF